MKAHLPSPVLARTTKLPKGSFVGVMLFGSPGNGVALEGLNFDAG
jgi:hypothetical protein